MKPRVLIQLTKPFEKEFKRLLKKYPSLKTDLTKLSETLLSDPKTGTPLGNNTFKIRLAIKSKGKGKSGGARVISHLETEIIGIVENNTLTLLSIYDKSEVPTISKEDIERLVFELQQKKS
jgi:mRNA-degrading endonuclease RelE of RelBE toxin-antitoxin system